MSQLLLEMWVEVDTHLVRSVDSGNPEQHISLEPDRREGRVGPVGRGGRTIGRMWGANDVFVHHGRGCAEGRAAELHRGASASSRVRDWNGRWGFRVVVGDKPVDEPALGVEITEHGGGGW